MSEPIEEMQDQLEALLGTAGVAALKAWLEANELSIVRLPSPELRVRTPTTRESRRASVKQPDNLWGMEKGKRYRIIYQRVGGRVYDECVAQYLGWDASRDSAMLSLRPKAGTSSLPPKSIKRVEPTEADITLPHRSALQAGQL